MHGSQNQLVNIGSFMGRQILIECNGTKMDAVVIHEIIKSLQLNGKECFRGEDGVWRVKHMELSHEKTQS